MSDMFVRSMWPVIMITFILMISYLLLTLQGKFVILHCFTASCLPSLNDVAARWLLRKRPEQAHKMIREWVLRHQPHIVTLQQRQQQNPLDRHHHHPPHEDDEHQQQENSNDLDVSLSPDDEELLRELQQHYGRSSLLLKTCIYKSIIITTVQPEDEEDGNDDDGPVEESSRDILMGVTTNRQESSSFHNWDDTKQQDHLEHESCTICFGPLRTGDRVGNLPCQHTFHVDCLKVWLTKRAVCPLCLRTDVVVRRANDGNNNSSSILGRNSSHASVVSTFRSSVTHAVTAEQDFERSGVSHPHSTNHN
jgi:hypothetical protein